MRRCSHPLVLIFSCSDYKSQESTVNNSSDAVNGVFCLPQRRIIFHLSVQRFSDHQMGKNLPFLLLVLWVLPRIHGDPRSNTVKIICSTQLEHNTTAYVPNFIAGMQIIADKIQSSGYGVSEVGSGPDANYGFAQCYGDLSPLDCVLCYAEMRTILPQCFPYSGGRVYLDGCYLRSENYSFFNEFSGKDEKPICGNSSRSLTFKSMAVKAVSKAIDDALKGEFFGRAFVSSKGSRNDSAHAMASCWKTLNHSSCESCLKDAAVMVSGCLPASEGRALMTGCFLRYSDFDFLNPAFVHRREIGKSGSQISVKRLVFFV